VSLEQVGQVGGISNAVAVQDNYAYVNAGPRLVIMDVSDRNNPVIVGQSPPLPDLVVGVAVDGQYAYVAAREAGLHVIDISNPTAPSEVGSYPTKGAAWSVAIGGNTGFLASDDGLHVLDISNPTVPSEIGFLATPDVAFDVTLEGNLAYVAESFSLELSSVDRGGLRIIDVSNPTNPTQIGYHPMNPLSADIFEEPSQPRGARAVAVVGSTAYLTYPTFRDGGIRIVDVSDPGNPLQIGDYWDSFPFIFDVVVVGDPATGSEPIYAYTTTSVNYGLIVLDVSDPADPFWVPDESLGFSEGVVVAGNSLYVGAGVLGGLQVVDISEPGHLSRIGFNRWPGGVRQVTVSMDAAYVLDAYGSLWLVDASDRSQPTLMGHYNVWDIDAATVKDDYAYLADAWTLQIVDISQPTNPVQVGTYDAQNLISNIGIIGHYVYLTTYSHTNSNAELIVVDVSDSAKPAQAGAYQFPARIRSVILEGDRAYVISDQIHLLDISVPTSLIVLGSYDPPGVGLDTAMVGNYLYVLTADQLNVLDVSGPADPLVLGSYAAPGYGAQMAAAGDYAYVVDGSQIRVIDVSDPVQLQEVDVYDLLVQALDVAAADDYVYVATADSGLVVLRLDLEY
jgi:hypothetical protein